MAVQALQSDDMLTPVGSTKSYQPCHLECCATLALQQAHQKWHASGKADGTLEVLPAPGKVRDQLGGRVDDVCGRAGGGVLH